MKTKKIKLLEKTYNNLYDLNNSMGNELEPVLERIKVEIEEIKKRG